MNWLIKICGLKDAANIDAAIVAGASHIGFVFHPSSPRDLAPLKAAALAEKVPDHITIVALVANAKQERLHAVVRDLKPQIIQFHGAEPPDQLAAFRSEFGDIGIWKALGVADHQDLAQCACYEGVVDQFLFDAKPPPTSSVKTGRPGGHGVPFDWGVLDHYQGATPWILAGGLTVENVSTAIARVRHLAGFAGLDISSGVEAKSGQKDPNMIHDFIATARLAMDA